MDGLGIRADTRKRTVCVKEVLMACVHDCEYCISVNIVYSFNLSHFIYPVILLDIEAVNPKVTLVKLSADSNYIFNGLGKAWQAFCNRATTIEHNMSIAYKLSLLIASPYIAQSNVSKANIRVYQLSVQCVDKLNRQWCRISVLCNF
jgi:hypothetical protein